MRVLQTILAESNFMNDKTLKMQPVFNGNLPSHFTDSFRLLKKYIEESLDIYKEELQSVLFPIFVELFLNMVTNRFVAEARQFFKDEKYQFSYQFKEDLNTLE